MAVNPITVDRYNNLVIAKNESIEIIDEDDDDTWGNDCDRNSSADDLDVKNGILI